ncbi:Gfo/Idh/MocA family oxidoreductase [Acinetobacter baumannii]|uniref:Gfo/Idh/MocA family protein n=1 Tax=Acinetobacter baumannii TaxID=470 RepID=UPI00244D3D78|nr:Gfo/Idh/MocA family oxidoreductase [Acinetobacter baumannii]MDH2622539.1 Gfo/Idh/MocA family oxidoreductase [Acinetobacter baumannii]
MNKLTDDMLHKHKIRAGMIGGGEGAFFASYHRAAMRLCNQFELVAGTFSSDLERNKRSGIALGIDSERCYKNYNEMLEKEKNRDDKIDVVIIVTPNYLHFEPCKKFIEAGFAVICDKPLVNSTNEALILKELVEEKGTFFAVTYTYTGYPMVRDARARIKNGEIGEVRFLYVEYLFDWLAYEEKHVGNSYSWRSDPLKAGPTGALGDIGTHAFNILEYVSGLNCTELNATLISQTDGWSLDDSNILQLKFESNAHGILWSSLAAPGHRNGLKFKIVGTKASLEWKQEEPEKLHVVQLGHADLIYRRGNLDMTEIGKLNSSLPAGNPEGYLEALANLYSDYAEAISKGLGSSNSFITGIDDGVRGVYLSEISIHSHQQKKWIKFNI